LALLTDGHIETNRTFYYTGDNTNATVFESIKNVTKDTGFVTREGQYEGFKPTETVRTQLLGKEFLSECDCR